MKDSPKETAIEIKNVVKKYADKIAVNGISIEIKKGECFGFLGPNGAGKSTLMKLMYCSSEVTSGELFVLDLNVKKNFKEIKSKIGVVPQEDGLDVDFNVLDNLLIFASYYGINKVEAKKRAHDLLLLMRLEDSSFKSVESLSGGMKRRLAIARGMINRPDIIFLDEPTTGLDPQARIWIWDFFKKQKEKNVTLVLTTHYMEEAESICDRIAIVDNGQVLAVGTPVELIAEQIGVEVVELEVVQQEISYYLTRLKDKNFESCSYEQKIIVYIKKDQTSKEILNIVPSQNIQIRKASLNDVFLKLAGHQLRDL